MQKSSRVRRASLILASAVALVVAFPGSALAAPPKALPANADDLEKTWQPAYDYDTDGCYTSYRLPDGVTYLAELELADGIENPLPAIQEFREFQAGLKGWPAAPPSAEHFEVRGAYAP